MYFRPRRRLPTLASSLPQGSKGTALLFTNFAQRRSVDLGLLKSIISSSFAVTTREHSEYPFRISDKCHMRRDYEVGHTAFQLTSIGTLILHSTEQLVCHLKCPAIVPKAGLSASTIACRSRLSVECTPSRDGEVMVTCTMINASSSLLLFLSLFHSYSSSLPCFLNLAT